MQLMLQLVMSLAVSGLPTIVPEESQAINCSICLSDIDERLAPIVTTNCNHAFHQNCLQPWLNRNHNTCPNCRAQLQNFVRSYDHDTIADSRAVLATGALFQAAASGSLLLAQTAIENGAIINQVNSRDQTPLVIALEHGRLSIVQLIIQSGVNVNLADYDQATPLMVAASTRNLLAISMLLNARAHVNAVDKDGYSALMYAVKSDCLPSVIALIQAGADLTPQTQRRLTRMTWL